MKSNELITEEPNSGVFKYLHTLHRLGRAFM